MKRLLLLLLVFMYSTFSVESISYSKSCQCTGGVCNCDSSQDVTGNMAAARAASIIGPNYGLGLTSAGTANTYNGNSDLQSTRIQTVNPNIGPSASTAMSASGSGSGGGTGGVFYGGGAVFSGNDGVPSPSSQAQYVNTNTGPGTSTATSFSGTGANEGNPGGIYYGGYVPVPMPEMKFDFPGFGMQFGRNGFSWGFGPGVGAGGAGAGAVGTGGVGVGGVGVGGGVAVGGPGAAVVTAGGFPFNGGAMAFAGKKK